MHLIAIAVIVSTLLMACKSTTPIQNKSSSNKEELANALWNDSGKNHDIGFWLYSKEGTCPSIRKTNESVLVFSPLLSVESRSVPTTVSLEKMQYCFVNSTPMVRCKGGQVDYTYVANKHQYTGTYSFTLVNGKVLQGAFNAQYCPPGN